MEGAQFFAPDGRGVVSTKMFNELWKVKVAYYLNVIIRKIISNFQQPVKCTIFFTIVCIKLTRSNMFNFSQYHLQGVYTYSNCAQNNMKNYCKYFHFAIFCIV
jgi:hypothetical protein